GAFQVLTNLGPARSTADKKSVAAVVRLTQRDMWFLSWGSDNGSRRALAAFRLKAEATRPKGSRVASGFSRKAVGGVYFPDSSSNSFSVHRRVRPVVAF